MRLPDAIKKEIRALRADLGAPGVPWPLDDLIEGSIAICKQHGGLDVDFMTRETVTRHIEKLERDDARRANEGDFFPDDIQLPVGEKERVRWDCMTIDLLADYERIQLNEFAASVQAQARKVRRIAEARTTLQGFPPGTKLRDTRDRGGDKPPPPAGGSGHQPRSPRSP
jgi:hypothetical protein